MAASATERRIIELVLKATGDAELKRIASELRDVKQSAQASQQSLDDIERAGRKMGQTIKGIFTGWIATEVLQTFTTQAKEAIDSLADLSDAAGGGSKQFEDYGKAAQEFQKNIAAIEKVIDDVTKGIVAGMLPALNALSKSLVEAVGDGHDFASVGKAIGDAMVYAAQQVASTIAFVQALGKAVTYTIRAASAAAKGFNESAHFRNDNAELFYQAAGNFGQAARDEATSAYAQGKAAQARIGKAYAAGNIHGRAAPTGDGGGGAGAGAGGKSRAAAAKEEDDAYKGLAVILPEITDQMRELTRARLEANEAMDKEVAALERAADPAIAYAEGLARINQLRDEGGLSAAAYALELERLGQAQQSANEALVENSRAEQQRRKQLEEQREQLEQVRDQWGFVADSMAQATYDIITGSESIGKAIKKMVATIIAEFIRMQLIKAATSAISSLFGGGGFTTFVATSAEGNAFGAGGLIPVPTAHTMRGGGIGIAGEAGPEAILPLQRNASGQLGVAAIGGGGGNPAVTVNNYAGADIGVRQTDQGLHIDVIRRQLAEDVRRGGSVFSAAMESTYRVGRQVSAS